jgi:hypothetical protein
LTYYSRPTAPGNPINAFRQLPIKVKVADYPVGDSIIDNEMKWSGD